MDMDLSTSYLGFDLPHPFMPGASPLVDHLDTVRRLEDAGAAAIVMHSLFEEQLEARTLVPSSYLEEPPDSFADTMRSLPEPEEFPVGPEEYLERLQRIRTAVSVPVIASLNGTTRGGWLEFAGLLEEAGADARELNIYEVATDESRTGLDVEKEQLEIVRHVAGSVSIPVAVKVSPFYTSFAQFALDLDEAGADGLVLFNRFFQPDVDLDHLRVRRQLTLSSSSELLLRLRWSAILAGRTEASLSVTGGVHTSRDAIKAIMCGAQSVQMVSALLRHGVRYLGSIRDEVSRWLDKHGYESLREIQGSLSLVRCPDTHAFERANYMHVLQSWRGWV